jgi:hypothetical protein
MVCTKAWYWKSVPIEIKHSDVGGCSDMKRVIRSFVRRQAWLVDVKVVKKGPIMVSSICKDHHSVTSVVKEASRRILTPQVHSEVAGAYHGDGLYTESLTTPHGVYCVRVG